MNYLNDMVECRLGYKIALPCNWVKAGFCGVDACACVIVKEVSE